MAKLVNPFKGMPKVNPLNDYSFYITFFGALTIYKLIWFFTDDISTAVYAMITILLLGWFLPVYKIRK